MKKTELSNGVMYRPISQAAQGNSVQKGPPLAALRPFSGLKITPRYHHHLSPDVVKDPWTAEEDMALAYAQNKIGNQWKQM